MTRGEGDVSDIIVMEEAWRVLCLECSVYYHHTVFYCVKRTAKDDGETQMMMSSKSNVLPTEYRTGEILFY